MRSRMAMDVIGKGYSDRLDEIARELAVEDAFKDKIQEVLVDSLEPSIFSNTLNAAPPTNQPYRENDILGDLIKSRLGINLPSINPIMY